MEILSQFLLQLTFWMLENLLREDFSWILLRRRIRVTVVVAMAATVRGLLVGDHSKSSAHTTVQERDNSNLEEETQVG